MNDTRENRLKLLFEVAAIAFVAFLARYLNVEHDPIHDELQHLLAAKSWVADGSFSVGDGDYTRGALYTVMVGLVLSLFDDSTTAARMLSVLLGTLWVIAIFVWCRARIGRSVAWWAALMFALAPGAIFLSQYIRFYCLHGVLFWLAAIAVYDLIEVEHRIGTRVMLALSVVVCLGAAAHLQPITLIGTGGLFVFAVIRLSGKILSAASTNNNVRNGLKLAALGVVGLAAVAVWIGLPQKLLEMYLWSPLWSGGGGPLRYHWMLVEQYPLLWGTLPIAVVLIVARNYAPGIFCASVFCVAIVVHSFAGMKAERFIYYAMPFFFVLSAILITAVAPWVRSQVASALDRAAIGPLAEWKPAAATFLTGSVVVFLVVSTPAMRTTADMLRGQNEASTSMQTPWSRYQTRWGAAKKRLEPLVNSADVVVTTQGMHLLYHFDRLDVELGASRLSDLYVGDWDQSKEFTIDPRTGRPVISSAESFLMVRECFGNGVVIVHDNAWRNRVFVPSAVADAIVGATTKVDFPEELGLGVFRWSTPNFSAESDCELLPLGSHRAMAIESGSAL